MKIEPLYDRILVKRRGSNRKVRGLYIPQSAQEKALEADVVAVGEGAVKEVDGKFVHAPMKVQPGDRVLVGKYAGTEIKLNEQDHLLIREDEVLGICIAEPGDEEPVEDETIDPTIAETPEVPVERVKNHKYVVRDGELVQVAAE